MKVKAKKPFSKMKPWERRVEIAKDVIASIKTNKFLPRFGVYIKNKKLEQFEDEKSIDVSNCKTDEIVRDLGKCEVCARGALFLSRFVINPLTMSKNSIMRDLFDFSEYGDEGYEFNKFQLESIEIAFEGREIGDLPWEHVEECIEFCKGVKSPEYRLLMIMQNIIDHNGTFVPSVKYEIV